MPIQWLHSSTCNLSLTYAWQLTPQYYLRIIKHLDHHFGPSNAMACIQNGRLRNDPHFLICFQSFNTLKSSKTAFLLEMCNIFQNMKAELCFISTVTDSACLWACCQCFCTREREHSVSCVNLTLRVIHRFCPTFYATILKMLFWLFDLCFTRSSVQ